MGVRLRNWGWVNLSNIVGTECLGLSPSVVGEGDIHRG